MISVKKASDLLTTSADTVKGFSWQAAQKASITAKFNTVADHFANSASSISTIDQIFDDPMLLEFALGACSLSRKSLNHIPLADQRKLISTVIDPTKLTQSATMQDLQRRYFLTCGDSLGGTMRNRIGAKAQEDLTDAIQSKLKSAGVSYTTTINDSGTINSIVYASLGPGPHSARRLFFNKKPKFIDKSIDFIVVKGGFDVERSSDFVACGELKGGIDPAGADEHWKTARAALNRIKAKFTQLNQPVPKLFFIGKAIEASMSEEMFGMLTSGDLEAVANLNFAPQTKEFVEILLAQ